MPDGISLGAGKSHVTVYSKVLPRWWHTVPGEREIQSRSGQEQRLEGNICSRSFMGLTGRSLSPRNVCLLTTCPALCSTSKKPQPIRSQSRALINHLTPGLQLSTNLISFFDKEDKHRRMDFGIWKNCLEFYFLFFLMAVWIRQGEFKTRKLSLFSCSCCPLGVSPQMNLQVPSIEWALDRYSHSVIPILAKCSTQTQAK